MKKKILISIFGVLFLIGGLFVGLSFVQKQQDIRKKAAPASTLSITPSSQIKNPGQSLNFTVRLDTGENDVMGVDFQLSFDPAVIQISQVSANSAISNFETEVKNIINNTTGKINYARFTTIATKAINGNFDIVSITGNVVDSASNGFSLLSFDSNSIVSALGEGQNVLISTVPGKIDVSGATDSPTDTPTPTPTEDDFTDDEELLTDLVTATPNSTYSTEIPESGISLPTLISLSIGTLLLVTSLLLAVL